MAANDMPLEEESAKDAVEYKLIKQDVATLLNFGKCKEPNKTVYADKPATKVPKRTPRCSNTVLRKTNSLLQPRRQN